jgi:tetratricopeptide (TPR) repeat protein
MKKLIVFSLLFISSFIQAQDFNTYLTDAKNAIESGNFRKAYDSSTKAIELNSTNVDARQTRVKASLTTSAPKERLETAITDLNYLISEEVDPALNYKLLGIAESELANFIYRFNRTIPDHEKLALSHYENALVAYNKAIALVPLFAEDLKYRINVAQEKITEIKS